MEVSSLLTFRLVGKDKIMKVASLYANSSEEVALIFFALHKSLFIAASLRGDCLLFIKSIFLLSISKKVTSCSFASRSPIDNPTYPMPTTVIFMLTSILKLFINQFFC